MAELDLSGVDDILKDDKDQASNELDLSGVDETLNEAPGMVESFGRGAAQGASMGFADEATGGLEALLSMAQGSDQDFTDLYSKHRDESRANYKKAEEANPITSTVGNLAGAFAMPAGIGAAKAGAGLAARALAGGTAGAVQGAAQAVGEAEKLDKNTAETAFDNAVIGGLLGAGVAGVAPGAVKVADDLFSKFSYYEQLKNVYKKAAAQDSLFGREGEFAKKNKGMASKVIDEFQEEQDKIGKEIKKLKDTLKGEVKVDTTVDDLRAQLKATSRPSIKAEQEMDNVDDILARLTGSEEKMQTTYLPKAQAPKASNADKTLDKATAARTKIDIEEARNTAKRALEYQYATLKEQAMLTGSTVPKKAAFITNDKIKSIADDIVAGKEFVPPTIGRHEGSGLDVAIAGGGPGKDVVMPVPKEQAALFTPLDKIRTKVATNSTPVVEAKKLQSTIDELRAIENDAAQSIAARQQATQSRKQLEELMQNPEYKAALSEVNSRYAQSGQAKAQLGMGSERFTTDFDSRVAREAKETQLSNQIEKYVDPSSPDRIRMDAAIDELAKLNPKKAEALRKEIKTQSMDLEGARLTTVESGLGQLGGGLGTLLQVGAKAAPVNVANVAGIAASIPARASKKLTDAGTALYNASPEALQGTLDTLMAKGSPFAKKLQMAMQQPDRKRKALLFTLMQNAGFRQDIGESDEPR